MSEKMPMMTDKLPLELTMNVTMLFEKAGDAATPMRAYERINFIKFELLMR